MLDIEVRADLRFEVGRLRRDPRRTSFPAQLHVGSISGEAADWPLDGEPLDVGLRSGIVTALLTRALEIDPRPAAWLTRPGRPEPHDLDLAWAPVLARAFAEIAVVPRCLVVVTRFGWYEPIGDERAEWKRLRLDRSRAPG